ncbi:MAG TPA: hypothetical protein VFY14_14160 [Streptomyces sp.]|nr:hypothetical protein [Streptomyces sp.]
MEIEKLVLLLAQVVAEREVVLVAAKAASVTGTGYEADRQFALAPAGY